MQTLAREAIKNFPKTSQFSKINYYKNIPTCFPLKPCTLFSFLFPSRTPNTALFWFPPLLAACILFLGSGRWFSWSSWILIVAIARWMISKWRRGPRGVEMQWEDWPPVFNRKLSDKMDRSHWRLECRWDTQRPFFFDSGKWQQSAVAKFIHWLFLEDTILVIHVMMQ